MNAALTLHLARDEDWTPARAANAKEHVERLLESPGWEAVVDALRSYELDLTADLLRTDPSENGSEYAQKIGHLNGLREIGPIVRGIVVYGEQAEKELRDGEVEPVPQGSE